MISCRTHLVATLACAAICSPALAGDLLVSNHDATVLTQSDVGKPFWSLQAQCAGLFGAAHGYDQTRGKLKLAEEDKAIGVDMLEGALSRLEVDRGVDRATAMSVAVPEVEVGRATGRELLEKGGTREDSQWNYVRSACLDIARAGRLHYQ